MSEQMALPTSRGSMAVEWAVLSLANRSRAASLFLRLRLALPEAKAVSPCRLWSGVVELVKEHPALPYHGGSLSQIARFSGDPEGLAFIEHMDAIASEATAEQLSPTLQGGER